MIKSITVLINTLILIGSFINIHLYAQSIEAESDHTEPHYPVHHNHIALFAGATTQLEQKGTQFSVGADYVRYLDVEANWGVSLFGEAIFAKHTEYLFGLTLYHHFTRSLWIRTGPGVEFIQEEVAGHSEHDTDTQAELLYRLGAGYHFHISGFTLSPSVDLDIVRKHTALVWGISLGKEF